MEAPIIYNLFPRLAGEMGRWPDHGARAREMGFNWIFINPIQYPGFSGSLYAVKDNYRINPIFLPPDTPRREERVHLRRALDALHKRGLLVMLDLVINHTAKDSELIEAHPTWFRWDEDGGVKSPSAIDPADARKVTVWGDLAEVDNANASDRQGLWAYWTALVQYYLELGFDGFRCDAAYKVPSALWEQLVNAARKIRPEVLFVAETLGCRLAEVRGLRSSGFDYLFNSSKWWQFDAPWCLQQHEEFGAIAPSIAFPESHDTPRLMQETGGLVQVQKQRYAFSAFFSGGVMMPLGYEYGFTRKLDVVHTKVEHWEETPLDLSPFIKTINRLKRTIPVLSQEGHFSPLTPLDHPTLVLRKVGSAGSSGMDPVLLLINKDWHQPRACSPPASIGRHIVRPFLDPAPAPVGPAPLMLEPAEVALLLP